MIVKTTLGQEMMLKKYNYYKLIKTYKKNIFSFYKQLTFIFNET